MKTHQKCPDCGHDGCLTIFDDGGTYCHSCLKASGGSASGGPPPLPEEELDFEVKGYRNIDQDVVEFYGILTGVTKDGKDFSRVYPYPHRPKTRILPKDFSRNAGFTNNKFFGMDKFNAGSSKVLTIVEGEDDVPSAYQMLGKKWPVVGIPGASSPRQVLKDEESYNFVKAFDSIVIATDSDDAGQSAADAFSRAFPNKCYRVNMTKHKDPNEYLSKGDGSDFLYAWVNRQKYVPDNILNTPDQFLELYRDTPDHMYTPTGIEALDEKIMGVMRGHFTVLKASTGIGKTEVMRLIEYNLLQAGESIAIWHLEETKLRSLLGLVSYEVQDNFTRKDLIEEKGRSAEAEAAIQELTSNEKLYQFFLRDGEGSDELIEQIRYFSQVCGVDYILVEPIQDIVAGFNEASKEAMLADLSVRLSRLAAELNVAIVTIAHTNDEGDIKYCRMIGQRASIIISLERNKESTDEEERNTTYLKVEKNRPCSLEGYGGTLFFDSETFTLNEKVF